MGKRTSFWSKCCELCLDTALTHELLFNGLLQLTVQVLYKLGTMSTARQFTLSAVLIGSVFLEHVE